MIFRILVNGRVQGVFFRRGVKRYADSHKLKGNVENKEDGSVLINLQCTKKEVDSLVKWFESSPGASKVEGVEVVDVKDAGERKFEGFEIIWSKDSFWIDKVEAGKNLGKKILIG